MRTLDNYEVQYNEAMADQIIEIVRKAARRQKVWPHQLFSTRKTRDVAAARDEVVAELRALYRQRRWGKGQRCIEITHVDNDPWPDMKPLSFPVIATLLGMGNHSTALLAWRRAHARHLKQNREREKAQLRLDYGKRATA